MFLLFQPSSSPPVVPDGLNDDLAALLGDDEYFTDDLGFGTSTGATPSDGIIIIKIKLLLNILISLNILKYEYIFWTL